jgi:hypothetical protein
MLDKARQPVPVGSEASAALHAELTSTPSSLPVQRRTLADRNCLGRANTHGVLFFVLFSILLPVMDCVTDVVWLQQFTSSSSCWERMLPPGTYTPLLAVSFVATGIGIMAYAAEIIALVRGVRNVGFCEHVLEENQALARMRCSWPLARRGVISILEDTTQLGVLYYVGDYASAGSTLFFVRMCFAAQGIIIAATHSLLALLRLMQSEEGGPVLNALSGLLFFYVSSDKKDEEAFRQQGFISDEEIEKRAERRWWVRRLLFALLASVGLITMAFTSVSEWGAPYGRGSPAYAKSFSGCETEGLRPYDYYYLYFDSTGLHTNRVVNCRTFPGWLPLICPLDGEDQALLETLAPQPCPGMFVQPSQYLPVFRSMCCVCM